MQAAQQSSPPKLVDVPVERKWLSFLAVIRTKLPSNVFILKSNLGDVGMTYDNVSLLSDDRDLVTFES